MSSESKHIDQYRHNKAFLDNGIRDKNEFSDWAVTVTFYCGIHLIEAMLARTGHNPKNHSERRDMLKYIPNRNDFQDEYLDLYNLSRQARYDCITIGKDQIFAAQVDLDAICSSYRRHPHT